MTENRWRLPITFFRKQVIGRRYLFLSAVILACCLPGSPAAGQVIPSALPAIGRPIDIRDAKSLTASRGAAIFTASHVYQTATRLFGADGVRRDLSLNQTFERRSLPVQATFGLTDRWNVGAGMSLDDRLERNLSALNFVPGATILGQDLPAGQLTRLEVSGSGPGDLDLLVQFRPRWLERRVLSLLAVDVIVPTGESNPSGPLDVPVGQGHWSARLSASALREIFPMTYFLKTTRQFDAGGSGLDPQGRAFTFEPGGGQDGIAGASYAIGASFALQGVIVGSWRDRGSRSDQPQPTPATRSLDFRIGYSLRRGAFALTQQLSLPIAGRNVLSTEGFLTSVEVHF